MVWLLFFVELIDSPLNFFDIKAVTLYCDCFPWSRQILQPQTEYTQYRKAFFHFIMLDFLLWSALAIVWCEQNYQMGFQKKFNSVQNYNSPIWKNFLGIFVKLDWELLLGWFWDLFQTLVLKQVHWDFSIWFEDIIRFVF